MKKIIALLTLTAALGLMTGCTDKDGDKNETSGATSAVTTTADDNETTAGEDTTTGEETTTGEDAADAE